MIYIASMQVQDVFQPSGWRSLKRDVDLTAEQLKACRRSERDCVDLVWPEFKGSDLNFHNLQLRSEKTVGQHMAHGNRAERRKLARMIRRGR